MPASTWASDRKLGLPVHCSLQDAPLPLPASGNWRGIGTGQLAVRCESLPGKESAAPKPGGGCSSSLDSRENLPESPVSWLPWLLAECSVSVPRLQITRALGCCSSPMSMAAPDWYRKAAEASCLGACRKKSWTFDAAPTEGGPLTLQLSFLNGTCLTSKQPPWEWKGPSIGRPAC